MGVTNNSNPTGLAAKERDSKVQVPKAVAPRSPPVPVGFGHPCGVPGRSDEPSVGPGGPPGAAVGAIFGVIFDQLFAELS